jgi:hypothetical protein
VKEKLESFIKELDKVNDNLDQLRGDIIRYLNPATSPFPTFKPQFSPSHSNQNQPSSSNKIESALKKEMENLSNDIPALNPFSTSQDLTVWREKVKVLLDNFIKGNDDGKTGIDKVKEKLEGFIRQLDEGRLYGTLSSLRSSIIFYLITTS